MSKEGLQKSAILLLTLGADEAAEVFKHLGPKEVQKLGTAMAEMANVSHEQVSKVLAEFNERAGEKTMLTQDSSEYIRQVLTQALGVDKASSLLERILHGNDISGIEDLKWMDARTVAELIHNEHPQIIATILVHLERDQASDVLMSFTERLRNDVMLRIATLDGIQPQALKELNDVLASLLSGSGNLKKNAAGGVRVTAEILNNMGSQAETAVLDNMRDHDPELAQAIQDEMFVFENLLDIDDRGIQLLLREVPSESLIVALKGTSDELREKIFKNMSQRAADMLRDDLASKGPVRVSEVEAQQKEIVKIVRGLVERGEIVIASGGEESFV
jgi:flagellar motor switch protein FliG